MIYRIYGTLDPKDKLNLNVPPTTFQKLLQKLKSTLTRTHTNLISVSGTLYRSQPKNKDMSTSKYFQRRIVKHTIQGNYLVVCILENKITPLQFPNLLPEEYSQTYQETHHVSQSSIGEIHLVQEIFTSNAESTTGQDNGVSIPGADNPEYFYAYVETTKENVSQGIQALDELLDTSITASTKTKKP